MLVFHANFLWNTLHRLNNDMVSLLCVCFDVKIVCQTVFTHLTTKCILPCIRFSVFTHYSRVFNTSNGSLPWRICRDDLIKSITIFKRIQKLPWCLISPWRAHFSPLRNALMHIVAMMLTMLIRAHFPMMIITSMMQTILCTFWKPWWLLEPWCSLFHSFFECRDAYYIHCLY